MLETFKIKRFEWTAVVLSFLYCFSILAAYYVMRPIRDHLAAEVGSGQLPLFFFITFLATLVLTPIYGWLVSKWPRNVIMPAIYLFFVVTQLAFIVLWDNPNLLSTKNLGMFFFVWVSVFNLFVISVFWSFMTDIWSDEQARRIFPIIAIGGTAGAVLGPIITRSLVKLIGFELLLCISAGFLILSVICIYFLGKWDQKYGENRNKVGNDDAIGGGILDGLKQIFSNTFVTAMAIMMLLSDAIGTISYVLVTDYSSFAYNNDAIGQTRFAASMDLVSNIIQVVLQLTATRWILVKYGAGMAFAICAVITVFLSFLVAYDRTPMVPVIGIFPMVALVLIITRSLAHSTLQAARETLYTLVPRDVRYKGKNAVETVVWRAGDVMSLLSISALRSFGVTASGFGIIWAFLAAISGLIGWKLATQTEQGDYEKE